MNVTIPEDCKLIGPDELGKILGRSTKYVKKDASQRPETLPPRFVVPGTRKVMWRLVDVQAWMQALAQAEQARRAEAFRFAREHGVTEPVSVKPFHLGSKRVGLTATEALEKSSES